MDLFDDESDEWSVSEIEINNEKYFDLNAAEDESFLFPGKASTPDSNVWSTSNNQNINSTLQTPIESPHNTSTVQQTETVCLGLSG
jgi:hypothetical protein